MKKTIIVFASILASAVISSSSFAQSKTKAFKVDQAKLKQGQNLLFSDADVELYAKVETGKRTTYSAKTKQGKAVPVTFNADVATPSGPTTMASNPNSPSSGNTGNGSAGTGGGTVPKKVEGGNTPTGGGSTSGGLKGYTCVFTALGLKCQ